MNNDTFASLKLLMNNLECESNNIPDLVNNIKKICQEALHLIDDLRFKNNSAHVQLATKQAVQYINKALFEIKAYNDAYNSVNRSSTVDIKDICSPIHAGLEIILNLDYK